MPMLFDIAESPFSRAGSYLAVSRLAEKEQCPEGLYFRSIRTLFQEGPLFLIEAIVNGQTVPFVEETSPECLRLRVGSSGVIEMAFDGADCLRFRTHGVGVRLTRAPGAALQANPCADAWRILNGNRLCVALPVCGSLRVDAPWMGTGSSDIVLESLPADGEDIAEFALLDTAPEWDGWRPERPFTACVEEVQATFATFLAAQLPCAPEFAAAREKAAYINWSALVNPDGLLQRPAMYMSKNWMNAVWSWDHCFNAIALAQGCPELAWDQFMVHFDHQTAQGALPDLLTDSTTIMAFVKPPIHGWALAKMAALNPALLTEARVREAYEKLSRLTAYWQTHRDPFGTGLPVYWHGNDSGWDNSTAMLAGSPVTGPDCAAFLVVQMDVLADLATRLGQTADALEWRASADRLQAHLIATLWRGDRFAMPAAADGREAPPEADSLLPYMSMLLGDRLPAEIRAALVAGLTREGRFLTDWGLATESLQSPYYQDNGYWRGPIWAPSTMLVIDGLQRSGEADLAAELARRFCTMCAEHGFAENFDAKTGQGLCDRAYTWTASVFLSLAHQLTG